MSFSFDVSVYRDAAVIYIFRGVTMRNLNRSESEDGSHVECAVLRVVAGADAGVEVHVPCFAYNGPQKLDRLLS